MPEHRKRQPRDHTDATEDKRTSQGTDKPPRQRESMCRFHTTKRFLAEGTVKQSKLTHHHRPFSTHPGRQEVTMMYQTENPQNNSSHEVSTTYKSKLFSWSRRATRSKVKLDPCWLRNYATCAKQFYDYVLRFRKKKLVMNYVSYHKTIFCLIQDFAIELLACTR